MSEAYVERILKARVYDVAIESPLDPLPRLSARTGNEVLLSRALDLDLVDYTAFEAALESLVDAAERLAGELACAAPIPMGVDIGHPDPRLAAMLRA